MRIISAMTEQNGRPHGRHPEQQLQAQRERQAAEVAHAIIATNEELRRTDLVFGPRWIEHLPTGRFFWEFGGDPSYAPSVSHYYVRPDGTPVMIEAADPPNRAEMERRQAAKAQRRQEKADAAKAHHQRLRASR